MNSLKENPLINVFGQNGIVSIDNLKLYHKGTRDISEINVLIDDETGSLILDKCVNDVQDYYIKNKNYTLKENKTLIANTLTSTPPLEDDIRRFNLYNKILTNKSILDFGCGRGEFLKKLKTEGVSSNLIGVELNEINREIINRDGIICLKEIKHNSKKYDFIFLNHVFEHLIDPINILTNLRKLLNDNGKIIIEIPHGNDFLIKESKIASFLNFTFWSEHICSYTEDLLKKLFQKLNYKDFHISYYQRYNLNNHIHWYKENEPGGHVKSNIYSEPLLTNYEEYLRINKITDTLMIVIGNDSKQVSDIVFSR